MKCREFAKRLLFESYVVCLPGTDFGDVGEGHLRFSYVRSMESLEEGMEKPRRTDVEPARIRP